MSVPEPARGSGPQLFLLGGMSVDLGFGRVHPPPSIGRTIAFVALWSPNAVQRARLAGEFWGGRGEVHAAANLRSALWRCRRFAPDLLQITATSVALHADVWLDLHHLGDVVRAQTAGGLRPQDSAVLLPEWDDDWVLFERERLRQRLLRRMEKDCEHCLEVGDYDDAAELALHAVGFEPLREHPHRLLIEAHLGRSETYEAVREYDRFRRLLEKELGTEPSPELRALVGPLAPRTDVS